MKIFMSETDRHSYIRKKLSPDYEVTIIEKRRGLPQGISLLSGNLGGILNIYEVRTKKDEVIVCTLRAFLGIWIVERTFHLKVDQGYILLNVHGL